MWAFSISCRAQHQHDLCRDGYGTFSWEFPTGVTIAVGSTKNGGFASHDCNASLRWSKSEMHVVAGAYSVDIDVLGADLGLGVPVVAFQTKDAASDKLMTYQIYSLEKPPRLLRTITGGDFYGAQDMNLEGRNEIWTHDAGAVDNFENLPPSSFDFLPTVALRFEKGKLTDVSAEFQPYFDRQISEVKFQLDARSLNAFKNTDGKLSSISPQLLGNLHELLRTKIAVLEIVWAYLYSGREQQAWAALADMWPTADFDRIRNSLESARAHGILRQVDEVSKAPAVPWKRHAVIYDMRTEQVQNSETAVGGASNLTTRQSVGASPDSNAQNQAETPPKPIYLDIVVENAGKHVVPESKVFLNLVVDAAGKVHSPELVNHADRGPIGDTVVSASASWNFIPAFRYEHPVASRIRLGVWAER